LYFNKQVEILNKDTYIFIINPIAGPKRMDLSQIITNFAKDRNIKYIICNTNKKGHGSTLVEEYLKKGYRLFVAVGGDGTVNEVATQLIHSEGVLGIVPAGSGNGLARSLGIPMDIFKALDSLVQSSEKKIDVGSINEKPFFCTTGIGFDAHCAHEFANGTHARGLINYVKVFFKNYFTYPIQKGIFEGKNIDFYTITFANAPQYGNNAYIAPNAKFDDKMLDCTIIKPHPKWYGVVLGYKLFARKIQESKYINCLLKDSYDVMFHNPIPIHIDGEAELEISKRYTIKVLPLALHIIYP
jgi:diacylglycerol kinase (ATP)